MPKIIEAPERNIERILDLHHAHQNLLRCVSEDDVKGIEEVLEQKIDINYVQAFFQNDVRYEHTALIIALRREYSETASFLIKNGADLNQALSLAFIYFSEERSLQDNLIAEGVDFEKAFKLAIEYDWDDETQEKWAKARILWLALVHQPDNVSLHTYLIAQGADINRVLWLVLEKQPDDDVLISKLMSKQVDLNRTLWLVMKEEPNNSALLISRLVSKGGDVEQALKMAIEKKWNREIKVALIPHLVLDRRYTGLPFGRPTIKHEWPHEVQGRLGETRILLLALAHQPENVSLHNHLISKGAKISIALCLVMVEQPDNRKLISYLMVRRLNIEGAFGMAIRHVWDDEAQERLGKAKLLLFALEYDRNNIKLHNYLISRKADIDVALWLAIEEQPDNRELISRLTIRGTSIDQALKVAIKHPWTDRVQACWCRAKILLLALRHQPKNAKLHRHLISRGAELNRALCLLAEKQPDNKGLISFLTSMGADLHQTLYLIMEERSDNKELISNIIAMGANLHRALCLVLKEEPDNRVLISRMIEQGVDIEEAFKIITKNKGKEKRWEMLVKAELLLLALRYQPDNTSLHTCFISNGADANRALWLLIDRQLSDNDLKSRLMAIGADLDRTLCLVMMERPDNIELISDLVSQGADIERASTIVIERDWKDKKREVFVKARLLLLALEHQPENTSLHAYLTSKGAGANKALCLAIEYEPGNEKLISSVISHLVFIRANLDLTLSVIMKVYPGNVKWVLQLVSQGAHIERALRMAIEDHGHFWINNQEKLFGEAELLLSALVYQPDNVSLHAEISRKADIHRALYFAVRREMDDELISKLTSQGADINIALCMAVFNEQRNKRAQSRLISMGADLNDALSVIVEKAPEDQIVPAMLKLVSKGANVDKALYCALKHKPENDALTSELISKGANVNKTLELVIRETPKEYGVMSRLISKGANPHRALSFAVEHQPENDELVSKLISKGANANHLIDFEKNYHVLHKAIDRGCSGKVTQRLLERGANPNEKMIVTRGGCEQIGFALVTLTNPIGWFYLSYLCCARGDCGNPFTKKYIDAFGLARLNHNVSAENAIIRYREEPKRVNEKTALLKNGQRRYGMFSHENENEKEDSKPEEVRISVTP